MSVYTPQIGGGEITDPTFNYAFEYLYLRTRGIFDGNLLGISKGSTDAADNQNGNWLWARMSVSGDAINGPTGIVTANLIQVTDTVDNGSTTMGAFAVVHRVGGGATRGTKHTIEANLGIEGAWEGHDSTGYKAAVAMQASAYAQVNVGGDGSSTPYPPSGYKGGLFGGNDHPRLAPGATYWASIAGREINVNVYDGASVWTKVGLWIVKGAVDYNRGVGVDGAIIIVDNADNPAPWTYGIQFGNITGYWPFANDSILIGTRHRLYPDDVGARDHEANYGVDFRDVVFTTAAFASNNFRVEDSGAVYARRFLITEYTVAVNTPPFSIVQRWDDAGLGVAFAGFSVNILDDSSSAGSILFDVQLDSASQMKLNKFGSLQVLTQYVLGSAGDVVMAREAADHLAIRRSTNAQKLSVAYTYGDASNYMRGVIAPAASEVVFGVETLGSGPDNVDVTLVPAGTGRVKFGTYAAGTSLTYAGTIQIKDAGGTVREVMIAA